MTTPERSLLQRREALVTANDIRSKRAQLKRDIQAGKVDPSKLIEDPPSWLCTMKIIDILLARPKVGRVKANRIMTACRMSFSKTVEGLSDRQRQELLVMLR